MISEETKRKLVIDEVDDSKFYNFLRRERGDYNRDNGLPDFCINYYIGASEKGFLLGVAHARIAGDTADFLDLMVSKKKRGLGIGISLIDKVREIAESQKCRQIVLETSDAHQRAKEIYLKYGFEIVAEMPNWKQGRTWYAMRLKL